MLTALGINQLAVVDSLSLELVNGLTVVTGETGAGKSIMIDALALCLGARADSGMVRHGAEKAQISAAFNLDALPAVQGWLRERELDEGTECVLRRVITADGRSRAFVNGHAASLNDVRELGEQLVSIHSQHQHQQLLARSAQLEVFDLWAGLESERATVSELWSQWQKLEQQFSAMRNHQEDYLARIQLLQYQVDELEKLGPQPDEFAALAREQALLASAGETLDAAQQCSDLLCDGENAAEAAINKALYILQNLKSRDSFTAASELLSNSLIQLREAASDIRHCADHIDLDPERLQAVDERLAEYHRQARKHLVSPADLATVFASLSGELAALGGTENQLDALQARCQKAAGSYQQAAKALSSARAQVAATFASLICESLRELEMPNAEFRVAGFGEREQRPGPTGIDDVEFFISFNRGQPAQPLGKVASGGELSRISLAIQVLVARKATLPCMIFDEVDVGVGGATAEIVGQKLRELAEHCQVICVTHQAQVAVHGNTHWHVGKSHHHEHTQTAVTTLQCDARVEEIARMVGGIEITESTRQHANEMLVRAHKPKQGQPGKKGKATRVRSAQE